MSGVAKVPTICPHCGFQQPEPAGALSTYCRGCGEHYGIGPSDGQPAGPSKAGAFAVSLKRKLICRASRERVTCHECGQAFREIVTPGAPCHCPSCGTRIERGNIVIAGMTTREIHTGGKVQVLRGAFLNAVSVRCAELVSEGRIGGRIDCTGDVRVGGQSECRAQIFGERLIVDRGARLRFRYPIHVRHALVGGTIEADLVGLQSVHVGRRGRLEGDVECKSIRVDRGGIYLGRLQVDSREARRGGEAAEPRRRAEHVTLWQPGLAFG